jgi:hypothetical protein
MSLIEGELAHDKRMNLTVYERSPTILLAGSIMIFIEGELFHEKRRKLIVYERLQSILFAGSHDVFS